ncbi:FAD-binding oxidoreductase [Novosphingobium sp.]|uniref:FAD-binding oxidoreductase n=1 Tax=Novosphingobium sp. TaxID=1874826 RepID=UPI00262FE0D1|nr:FAD-binding oxidoreductase [Novosphingobium sp.]
MSMLLLPPGLDEAAFATALDAMRAVAGVDFVFGPDHPNLVDYNDRYPIDDLGRFAPAAAVAPDGVDQVRAIVRIANAYRIPLWTFSTGRNFAYGGAAPRTRGSVVLDLHRMNRILAVDEEAGTCLVEPGVTYFQLYAHLQELGGKLWPSPPELGWASVIGNALEHGVGYTPMGDNFGFSCGMEVVLPDGDLLRTGMGAMAGSNSWQLSKYGFGPVMDGLFSQSNFGIVTKLGMWLMPAPPANRTFMITFPRESDLAQIIEIMRPLKLNQIIQNAGMVTPWTYEANLAAPRSAWWDGPGPIPEHAMQGIIDKLDIGFWNLYATQYGLPELMDAQLAIIKNAFLQIEGARFFFAEDRPDLPGVKLRELVGRGEPNLMTLDVFNWLPNAGHIDFSPVSPSTGKDATELYELIKAEVKTYGFDYIGAFIIGWRELHNILLIFYDKTDADQQARAREMFSRLVQKAATMGYGEYRTHLAFMDEVAKTFDFNDNAMLRLSERIKDALDPNGVLSAGKSGIWPRHLRQESM